MSYNSMPKSLTAESNYAEYELIYISEEDEEQAAEANACDNLRIRIFGYGINLI